MFHHPRRSPSTGAQSKAHTLLATILVALLAFYLASSHARPAAAQTGPIVSPPGPPPNTSGIATDFETGTTEGWVSRTGVEMVSVTSADQHGGSNSPLTTNRTAAFRGPAIDVTNVMFNGSRYRISLWAKLAPGEANTQLRVSLERRIGAITSFHTVIGNTAVTANQWVNLKAAVYDLVLANQTLILYVESAGGMPPSSFYIDDFTITFVPPPVAEPGIPSVYQSLAEFFPVGAAVWQGDLTGEHAVLLKKHFNSVTSENDMKWSTLQPTEGSFNFAPADAQVSFAKANNMAIRGHTLVWHNQNPAWLFNDTSGNPMTPTPENKALLLQRMENHIRAVVSHYKDDVYAWDVVNEVIDPTQPDGFRRSPWFNITGVEYIERAFQDPLQLPGADISMSMSADSGTVLSGGNVSYTITVKNNQDNDLEDFLPDDDDLPAANVSSTSAIPAGTVFRSLVAPSGWSCTTPEAGSRGQVNCTVDSLAPGASAQFKLTLTVVCAIPDGQEIVNSATAASATRDPSSAPNNTASVNVWVSNPPPIISGLTVDKPVLWPPNHKMELVKLDYSVSDNCDAGLVPTITISSNQPVNGTGDGDTEPDWEVIDAHHIRLRAERSATSREGRIYTITLTIIDSAGSSSRASVEVKVPR